MNSQYLVTIGIPVFRAVDYIDSTINTALNQTFPDIEFLIVDDCGNDGSMDVVRSLQKRHPRGCNIRILTNKVNSGVGFSRNRIIDEARGRFLYFLDSDDTIEPNTIQILYEAVIVNHCQIAYGSYEIFSLDTSIPPQKLHKRSLVIKGNDNLAIYFFKNTHIFHASACNCLVELSLLRQNDLRFINAAYWEDLAFSTELVTKASSAVFLPDITYHYIQHSGSLSHYQKRNIISKQEVLNNIFVLKHLKNRCLELKDKPYLPYLCYNVEMTCFYAACHILRKKNFINPQFTYREIQEVVRHPFSLFFILSFNYKRLANLVFGFMGITPLPFFHLFLWVLAKMKRAI